MEGRSESDLKTTPDLPYELWALIASLVPKDRLQKLCGVHRAFYDRFMNEMYREVRMYHKGDESTRRCLVAMGLVVLFQVWLKGIKLTPSPQCSPSAASYVRKLVLRPHLFGGVLHSKAMSYFARLYNLPFHFTRSRHNFNGPPGPLDAHLLLHKVTQMTNLTSLLVGCYPSDNWRSFNRAITFLDAAFTQSSHLQILTLDIPLESMARVFFSTPYFPVLEDLRISVRVESLNKLVHMDAMPEIATFINRQSSNLIRLSIDIFTTGVDPSPLFWSLNKLQKLAMISIGQPVERLQPGHGGTIDVFLGNYAAFIFELGVHFYGPTYTVDWPTPETFFSGPIFQLNFVRLRCLHLGLAYWDEGSQASLAMNLAQYLSKFRSTLTELAITDYDLSLPVVQRLVLALGGDGMVLYRLKMRVRCLSCDLLDLLAYGLPELYELDLNFDSLSYKDNGSWPDTRVLVRVYYVRFFIFK